MPLLILSLLFPFPKAPPAEVDHLKAAIDAARVREERLRTLVISWKVTTLVPKGSIMLADPTGQPLPRADKTYESNHTLILDGTRYRQEDKNPGWAPGAPNGTEVFDGTRLIMRRVWSDPQPNSQVIRLRQGENAELGSIAMAPITFWCRGRHRWEQWKQKELVKVHDARWVVDDVRYVEFRVALPSGRHDSYYVVPASGYLPLQIGRGRDRGKNTVDITYQDDPVAGRVPSGWTVRRQLPDLTMVETVRAVVTEVRVGESLPAETFRLNPSPGDTVIDHETKQQFLVGADGILTEIQETSDPGAPGKDGPALFRTPPGMFVRILPVIALAVFLLIVMLLRRPAQPPHKSSP
jgi:hypothetical protein